MSSQVAAIVFGFVVLPLTCIACERLWPSVPDKPVFRRGFASDVVWYFVQTYVSRAIAPWVVYFVLVALLPAAQISSPIGNTGSSTPEGYGEFTRCTTPPRTWIGSVQLASTL